jgi:hypothetical protein
MLGFKQWPFELEEIVTLRWIKSPYKNKQNKWMLPVLFERGNGEFVRIETMWGVIPWLRFGQRFQNGNPEENIKEGTVFSVKIENVSNGYVSSVSDLNHSFMSNGVDINREHVWVIQQEGKKLIVPCIEIVRSFFLPNATLANAVLQPNGLEYMVPFRNYIHPSWNLEIDRDIPKQIITDSFVKHLAWIVCDKKANETWHSVLLNIFPNGAIENEGYLSLFDDITEIKSQTINIPPPFTNSCTWQVRGIETNGFIYIYEILTVDGLNLPYKQITYSHKPIIKRRRSDGEGLRSKKRIRKKQKNNVKMDIVNQSPRNKSQMSVIANPPTTMLFQQEIKVKQENKIILLPGFEKDREIQHLSRKERRLREIEEYQKKLAQQSTERKEDIPVRPKEILFSSGDVYFDGNSIVQPLEFRGINITHSPFVNGLDQFYTMIILLNKLDSSLRVLQTRIIPLPGSRGFSLKEDGTPRNIALVTLDNGNSVSYILEVERLKKINLSTLLICPRSGSNLSESEINILMDQLLNSLVRNYGHWDKDFIKNQHKVRIKTIKHLESWTDFDWARVILESLYY